MCWNYFGTFSFRVHLKQKNVYRENTELVKKGSELFWLQLGNRFFFSRAVCNHEAMLFLMIASPLATHIHTHAEPHTHVRAHIYCTTVNTCARRGNVTSQHQQNIQREDQSEETSDTPVQVILAFFAHHCAPTSHGPAVVLPALWINQVCCQGNRLDI